jgi:hypothetical protein
MAINPLPGVYNQVSWPGVGDVDDCSVIATFWALVASGHLKRENLPTVAAFRAAAGVPDGPGPSGITNAQVLTALGRLYPAAKARSFVGGWAAFLLIIGRGEVASLSVRGADLPAALRYGFDGPHQVGLATTPGPSLRLMNPLGPQGTVVPAIPGDALRKAAEALFGDGKFHAVVIPPPPDPHLAQIAALQARITKAKAALG